MAEDLTRPDDQLIIDDLEALRILSDPLRMRLIEILRRAPVTVKDIASILETSPKSLYYHINLLERHNLIRVVDSRLVSGILEKRYRATAYLFIFSDLCARTDDSTGDQGTQVLTSSLFAITNEEIRESIGSGRIDLDRDAPIEHTLQWNWHLLHLRPEDVADLAAQMKELLARYMVADGTPLEDDRQTFRCLYTLFPTYYRGTLPAGEKREDAKP